MTAAFSFSDHNQLLGSYGKPEWLIASKPDASAEVFEGSAVDLTHNYWLVRTHDPYKVRDADFPFDFSQPVGADGLLLTDASLANDLLSSKILAIESLRGQYLSSSTSRVVLNALGQFYWIIRWRIALGVPQFQKLSPSLFDVFCEKLEEGLLGLIPIESRITRMEKRLHEGEWTWPVQWFSNQPRIDFGALGAELGVGYRHLMNSAGVGQRLRGIIKKTAPALYVDGTCRADADNESADTSSDENSGLASNTVAKALNVWRMLHYISSIGLLPHDPLIFDPFSKISLAARVKQIARKPNPDAGVGKDGKRTGTPSPEQWLRLLDGAARWVLDYGGPIMTIIKLAREKQFEIFLTPTASSVRQERFRNEVQAIIDEHLPADRAGAPRIAPLWARSGPSGNRAEFTGITLNDALSYLVTACIVLIGGLAARRGGELDSLQADYAYKDQTGSGNWLFSVYIEKTVRDNAEIPIPAMVAVAVKLLEELSATARERTGTNWITRVHRPGLTPLEIETGERVYINTRLRFTLNEFADLVAARQNADGTTWDFAPHQLRRAFSVYYYHGNRFSNLDALSRFLRHFDPQMTERYITEVLAGALSRLREVIEARSRQAIDRAEAEAEAAQPDPVLTEAKAAATSLANLAKDHEDVRQEHFVVRALEVYDGDEAPIGRGASALYDELEAMVENARRRIRIDGRSNISPDQEREALISQLRERAPTRYLEPHPGQHAHCGCTRNNPADLVDAVCLKNKTRETGITDSVRPDYAFASSKDCFECRHGIGFSEDVRVMDRKVADAEVAAVKAPNAAFRVAAKARLLAYKEQLASAREAVRGKQRL